MVVVTMVPGNDDMVDIIDKDCNDKPDDEVSIVLDNTGDWAEEILFPGADEEGLFARFGLLSHLHIVRINQDHRSLLLTSRNPASCNWEQDLHLLLE